MTKIVILSGNEDESTIIYNYLSSYYPVDCILKETPMNQSEFLRKRIVKLGVVKVLGQVLFMLFNTFFLKAKAKKRKLEILNEYGINSISSVPNIINVGNVNGDDTINLLLELRPDIVIVNGTRILSKKLLSQVNACFLNIHAGITPKYRGVHGGYWALYNKDHENCGTTVHLIDEGIDTGGVIYQGNIKVEKEDSINTYGLIQLCTALPLLKNAIDDVVNDDLSLSNVELVSKIWSHPTLLQYVFGYFVNKVK